MIYPLKFSAQDHVPDLEAIILKVYQDLGLVHVDLDLILEADHVVFQNQDHIQVVDLNQVAVLIQVVCLVLEVIHHHVVVLSQLVDQGLVLLLVLNHVHDLIVNLSLYQDHQLDQSLVVVLLPIHLLIQEVGLHQIHLQDLNLEADLPDPGNFCNYIIYTYIHEGSSISTCGFFIFQHNLL